MKKTILPPGTALIKADIQRMHSAALKDVVYLAERDLSRLETVRASQLPFCPLSYVLSAAKGGPFTPMEYHSSYFTSVGTTVHEVLQRFHGNSGKFLANWECQVCKKRRQLSHESKCCGITSDYNEIKIKHKWVVGHIDGVYRDEQDNYWILDYKTTSTARLPTVLAYPGASYVEQSEAYAFAVQEQYGIKIRGIIVAFVVRDNPTEIHPWVKELHDSDYVEIGRRLEHYTFLHKRAYVAHTKEHLKWLWKNRMCKPHEVEEKAGYCQFKRGCADNDPTEAITWFKQGLRRKYIPIKAMVEARKESK